MACNGAGEAMRQFTPLSALFSLLLWSACGGAPPPQELITNVTAAIRAAEVAGAKDEPKATLHLKKAGEQLAQGKALAAEEDERAERVLLRAEADADLALALAQEHAAKVEAETANEKVEKMRTKVK
jgi:hypothetical protein